MPRLTADERASLADLSARAKAEDDHDQELELLVQTEGGHTVKLTGAKAARYARKNGLEALLDLDDQDDDQDGEEELEDDKAPAGKESIFRGRGKK